MRARALDAVLARQLARPQAAADPLADLVRGRASPAAVRGSLRTVFRWVAAVNQALMPRALATRPDLTIGVRLSEVAGPAYGHGRPEAAEPVLLSRLLREFGTEPVPATARSLAAFRRFDFLDAVSVLLVDRTKGLTVAAPVAEALRRAYGARDDTVAYFTLAARQARREVATLLAIIDECAATPGLRARVLRTLQRTYASAPAAWWARRLGPAPGSRKGGSA